MQNSFLSFSAITLYVISGTLLAWRFFGQKQDLPVFAKPGLIITGLVATLLHGAILYDTMLTDQGLNIGIFYAASLITWLMALTILLASLTNPVENLGVFLLPAAALAILLNQLFPVDHVLVLNQARDLRLHIVLSVLAYSLISIAAVHAILLAIQERHLRNRHPGGFIRALPPLQTMETLLFQMIGLGFFLHSLSLITGIINLEDMFAQHVAHHTVLSIVAWFVFAILLWGRWRFGWRGMTAIRWTLGGFVTLGLAYIGSKWVLEVLLK
ncbi:MAG: cytochrome c biogenesis protein CcsA [Gammaproteobacteria bacterium]|nr:cytochrome c biogenesis protein CcsA [Gammaproteobacteria bacterium]MDH5801074.1 cytochrome c biogenesis protein CcsA [Gammaproteobacteria bacterium]